MSSNSIGRRNFIKTVGAVTTTGTLVGSLKSSVQAQETLPQSTVLGANDRVNYGIIGMGGMGGGHLNIISKELVKENAKVIAVSDVFEKRLLKGQTAAELPASQAYKDYRKLLENKDIDAVVIATPDHWHGQMTIDALEAGKHVYLEKPMTRTFNEAVKVWKVAKRTNKLVQIGAHGCSDPKWHKAAEIVKSGKLGMLLWAQGSYCRNNPKGEWNYDIEKEANANTVDWKQWLGNAPKREWSPERFFRWRKYWDYGTGIIGDLWPHRLYPLMLAMSLNEFPLRVSCIGRNLCNSDKGNGEVRDVADTTMMMVEYPSGIMIYLAGSTVNERGLEDVIRGNKASVIFGGGKVQLLPERPYVDEIEQLDMTPATSGLPGMPQYHHQQNFLHAIRNNAKLNCDIELGIRVQAIVSMAEESFRRGKLVNFDSKKMKIYS
jgi:predicted dehydrogenase